MSLHLSGADGLAVAQHAELVGDAEDLLHAVGDEDDGLAVLLPLLHQFEEALHLAAVEAGRGLIQDEHPRVGADRLEHFDDLLFIRRQRGHGIVRVQVGLEGAFEEGQQFLGARVQGLAVNDPHAL